MRIVIVLLEYKVEGEELQEVVEVASAAVVILAVVAVTVAIML